MTDLVPLFPRQPVPPLNVDLAGGGSLDLEKEEIEIWLRAFDGTLFGDRVVVDCAAADRFVSNDQPRGPIPRPDYLVHKLSSSIREFASRPNVTLVDEHAFDSLETPKLFKDAFHLNDAGCSRLSEMMAREVSRLVR